VTLTAGVCWPHLANVDETRNLSSHIDLHTYASSPVDNCVIFIFDLLIPLLAMLSVVMDYNGMAELAVQEIAGQDNEGHNRMSGHYRTGQCKTGYWTVCIKYGVDNSSRFSLEYGQTRRPTHKSQTRRITVPTRLQYRLCR